MSSSAASPRLAAGSREKQEPRTDDPGYPFPCQAGTHGPRPLPPWQDTEGLCALLEAAKRLPPCDPADIPGVFAGAPGLAGLLWEARQWQQEEGEA